MAEVDPETLLEWLQMGQGDERDMQLIALEQLCMLLLMSDNVDRCFESCPPRTFLPGNCTNYNVQSAVCLLLILSLSAMHTICLFAFLFSFMSHFSRWRGTWPSPGGDCSSNHLLFGCLGRMYQTNCGCRGSHQGNV